MRVRLEYGRDGLEAELPDKNLVAVLRLKTPPPLSRPESAIEAALARPIAARPLEELALGRRDACIVVCDITRPVPNSTLLPPVLATLERAGIPRDRTTILIATGTHRPNEGAELDAILGEDIAHTYRVVNHVCADAKAQTYLGTTEAGVPVHLDRTYCEADLKITIGLIEPHFMAGYSGGRKLIMPGLAALETVQAWHSPRFLEHPNASNGVVFCNPVHDEALRIAKMMPPDMILDVTLDEENRITGVFAGDLEEAWLEGVRFAEQSVSAPINEPVDIVVTTCAGHPLDATFYQAVKGMVGALPILKPGGSIVIAASCSEGIGSPEFTRTLLETDDLRTFRHEMQQPGWKFIPDQWEVEELAKAAVDNHVFCVCDGIDSGTLSRLFVTPASTVEHAVEMAMATHGQSATLAAIPKGPYVIPYVP